MQNKEFSEDSLENSCYIVNPVQSDLGSDYNLIPLKSVIF